MKKVLLCRPIHFDPQYTINPWMKPGTINKEKALQQWNALVKTYQQLGVDVVIIEQVQEQPDMVFATDQGIVKGNTVLLSNFRHPERKGETTHYKKWFHENNYTISSMPEDHFFEGNGESYFWNNMLFVGVGYRSTKQTTTYLAEVFQHTVTPLEIIDPAFYHLDVGFFPLNETTIFYYPPAYSKKTRQLLNKLVPNLIPFTKEEAEGFAANSIRVNKHVLFQAGNDTFANTLRTLHYTPLPLDVGEFKKSGGGIHCLTNVLG